MILILFTWLINGFLMSTIYVLIVIISNKAVLNLLDWLILGYVTTTFFMLVGISGCGDYLLKLYLGCRDAINRELEKTNILLSEVLSSVNQKYQTNFQVDNINIMIVDSKIPDSRAIGYDTIVLTEGLLKNMADEELQAVLAYELGHLYYRDSIIFSAIVFGSAAVHIMMGLSAIYIYCYRILTTNTVKFGNKGLHLIPLLAIVPIIIFFPIAVLNWIVKQIFDVTLYSINHSYVYRADKFVSELGYKKGLINYLETLYLITYVDKSIIGRIFTAHTPEIKRIGRLDG